MEGDLHMLKGPNGNYYVSREGKQGAAGMNGADGMNTYFAYASDANGNGISLTPSAALPYIAFVQSDVHCSSDQEIIALFDDAVWLQYLGQVTVEQMNAALAGKANVSHTHARADVTGLVAALADVVQHVADRRLQLRHVEMWSLADFCPLLFCRVVYYLHPYCGLNFMADA